MGLASSTHPPTRTLIYSLSRQLNNGVRFIDFRTMYESKLDSW